jgi:hypothetical protein
MIRLAAGQGASLAGAARTADYRPCRTRTMAGVTCPLDAALMSLWERRPDVMPRVNLEQ